MFVCLVLVSWCSYSTPSIVSCINLIKVLPCKLKEDACSVFNTGETTRQGTHCLTYPILQFEMYQSRIRIWHGNLTKISIIDSSGITISYQEHASHEPFNINAYKQCRSLKYETPISTFPLKSRFYTKTS